MSNLEKVGLIKKKSEVSNWDKLKQPLKLINENVDHENPQDLSYIYLAYAPISVRLVQELVVHDNWKAILQTIRDLPGETVIQHQIQDDGLKKNQGCIVVYFIGGVCYGEIAALRWLAEKYNQEIKVCTTHITSGNRMIRRLKQLILS